MPESVHWSHTNEPLLWQEERITVVEGQGMEAMILVAPSSLLLARNAGQVLLYFTKALQNHYFAVNQGKGNTDNFAWKGKIS